MPQLRSDVVEVFVVRWRNGQLQALLGRRKPQQPIGSLWQPFSARIDVGEATVEAAKRAGRARQRPAGHRAVCRRSDAPVLRSPARLACDRARPCRDRPRDDSEDWPRFRRDRVAGRTDRARQFVHRRPPRFPAPDCGASRSRRGRTRSLPHSQRRVALRPVYTRRLQHGACRRETGQAQCLIFRSSPISSRPETSPRRSTS